MNNVPRNYGLAGSDSSYAHWGLVRELTPKRRLRDHVPVTRGDAQLPFD